MIVVVKRRRLALRVALGPLVAALFVAGLALRGGLGAGGAPAPPPEALMLAATVCLGLLVHVLLAARVVRARAHTLVVGSLLGKTTFDARTAAFGVSATYGARHRRRYTVYVTDGMRRADIGAFFSRRSLRAAQELTEAFAVPNPGGSVEARGFVAREIEAWKRLEATRSLDLIFAWHILAVALCAGGALYLTMKGLTK